MTTGLKTKHPGAGFEIGIAAAGCKSMSTEDERKAPPHDSSSDEPLGPVTPDDETELGDTPEAHDEISPHDLPLDHPGRQKAEAEAQGERGTTGNA
jgi:hypothetical protein